MESNNQLIDLDLITNSLTWIDGPRLVN